MRLIQSIFTWCKVNFISIIFSIWMFWVTANIIIIQMRLNGIEKDIGYISKSIIIIIKSIGFDIPLEMVDDGSDSIC